LAKPSLLEVRIDHPKIDGETQPDVTLRDEVVHAARGKNFWNASIADGANTMTPSLWIRTGSCHARTRGLALGMLRTRTSGSVGHGSFDFLSREVVRVDVVASEDVMRVRLGGQFDTG
jgi:hypothetical protein